MSAEPPGVQGDAPDLTYRDARGAQRRLSEAWEHGPALIIWLRHFG